MSSPLPHRVLPIAYVTDNDRDAEALSCRVDGTVIVKREVAAFPTPKGNLTSQSPKRLRRSNVRNVSTTANVSGVLESETFQYISSVSDAPDVPDVSNASTLDL